MQSSLMKRAKCMSAKVQSSLVTLDSSITNQMSVIQPFEL